MGKLKISHDQVAYGALWRSMSGDPVIIAARKALLAKIGGQGSEGQREAVSWAVDALEPVTEAEIIRQALTGEPG